MKTELLNVAKHNRSAFDCGDEAINNYLQRQARQDAENRYSKVHVVCQALDPSTIQGFFTLSAGRIDAHDLPDSLSRKFGNRQEIPVFILGRLGVDIRYKGQGLGQALVSVAIQICLQSEVGSAGLLVDAKSEELAHFYERIGFIRLPKPGIQLMLPLAGLQ